MPTKNISHLWPTPEKVWKKIHDDFAGPTVESTYLVLVAKGCTDADEFSEQHHLRIKQDLFKIRISKNFSVTQWDTVHSG